MTTAAAARVPGGPFALAWRLLTNVKFALLLVGVAALAGLAGSIFPQVPPAMRGNPAARAAWLELRRDDFGPFTAAIDRAGFFDLSRAPWFLALWALIALSLAVCTVSRFRPTWRSVHRPQPAVSEAFFDAAHHRARFAGHGGAASIVAELRRRRYHVATTALGDGAVALSAERFRWSAYATFVSHLALLILLLGGLLTRFAGFDTTIALAEGTPPFPVLREPGPGQVFVSLSDAVRRFDAGGHVIDYRSVLSVRRGDETVACDTTVNTPCEAFGYRIHQAAFFDDLARLRVADGAGRTVFDDVVDFRGETTVAPRLRVSAATGEVLFDQPLPQLATDEGSDPGREDDLALSVLAFPFEGTTVNLAAAWRVDDGDVSLVLSGGGLLPTAITPGESATGAGFRVEFTGVESIPARTVAGLPGAPGETVFQMPMGGDGRPYLLVSGLDDGTTILEQDQPLTVGGYTFTFRGRIEGSGVSVRRDPGAWFIWVAVGLGLVGLTTTFYLPRRRLWALVTPGEVRLAAMGERRARLSRELEAISAAVAAKRGGTAGS